MLRRAIGEIYPTLKAAEQASDPLYDQLKHAKSVRGTLVTSITNRMFKDEFKQHFQRLGVNSQEASP